MNVSGAVGIRYFARIDAKCRFYDLIGRDVREHIRIRRHLEVERGTASERPRLRGSIARQRGVVRIAWIAFRQADAAGAMQIARR